MSFAHLFTTVRAIFCEVLCVCCVRPEIEIIDGFGLDFTSPSPAEMGALDDGTTPSEYLTARRVGLTASALLYSLVFVRMNCDKP